MPRLCWVLLYFYLLFQRVTKLSKRCTKCHQEKHLGDYFRDSSKKDGLTTHCKACKSAQVSAYRANNNEVIKEKKRQYYWDNLDITRDGRRFSKYNVTKEWYEEQSANGCQACGSMESLCIDHDHSCCPGKSSCGKCVRGILCTSCNTAEGYLGSDIKRVEQLLDYMRKHNDR